MKAKLTIGTRQSLLALWQSNHIAALLRKEYPECEVVLKKNCHQRRPYFRRTPSANRRQGFIYQGN